MMKRSRINDILRAADGMIRHFGFALPPFAYWSPQTFQRRTDAARIVAARMGWDITDYGQGRFDQMGLSLFTLRNGDGLFQRIPTCGVAAQGDENIHKEMIGITRGCAGFAPTAGFGLDASF